MHPVQSHELPFWSKTARVLEAKYTQRYRIINFPWVTVELLENQPTIVPSFDVGWLDMATIPN